MESQPKHRAITLTDQIRWWTNGGNFNGELYLRICEHKTRITVDKI